MRMKIWRWAACVLGLLMVLCSGNVAAAAAVSDVTSETLLDVPAEASLESMPEEVDSEGLTPNLADVSPVQVTVLDDEDLNLGMLYGTRVFIPEGTRYYASADGRGSGPYGVMGGRYAPMGADYYIGGFSILTEEDRLDDWEAYNPEYVPVAEDWSGKTEVAWDDVWVVIFRNLEDDRPLGWVPARSIAVINGILGDGGSNEVYKNGIEIVEKDEGYNSIDPALISDALQNPGNMDPEVIDKILQDPGNAIEDRIISDQDEQANKFVTTSDEPFISTREIAYAIEDYADNGDKVALLMDASGSVADYMADIANYGAYVDKVNKADIIIAFAKRYMVISAEEYLDAPVNVNGTDIYGPLNGLEDAASYDRIIIVTDTYHNIGASVLEDVTGFAGKIVIVCTEELSMVDEHVISKIEVAFGTTVYLCRLNNQLDQIQALEMLNNWVDAA